MLQVKQVSLHKVFCDDNHMCGSNPKDELKYMSHISSLNLQKTKKGLEKPENFTGLNL